MLLKLELKTLRRKTTRVLGASLPVSNLTSKVMKMCEKILKKTAPKNNSNSLNCKNIAGQKTACEQTTTSEKADFC